MTTTAPGTVPVEGGGPARDRVYAWLRDGIISGELEGGRFLDELWVSGVVGVSRTPVREAFHRLEAERFISLLPRKGAQVRTVTARELEEVYQSRRLIEGHALGEVCAARAGAPAEMAGLIEAMDRAGKDRDWFAVSGLDRQFHRAIVNAAGNSVLTELYDTLRSRQQRVAVRALEARPERLSIIDAEHRQLVAAIDAHEPAAALRLLNEHLRPVSEVVSALERG
ncbi:GntR family transcriptional regulator [Amycolatopsis saalfeldensis]|uniref:DNA-binding transcriptional regulator, GntR family n=1 Tax=Amycolatopsis saalfeldensis TaxID=394193 RepID=A0A1H8T3W2_9PSEU|nr:GntR family transcriptional regulator [Amycolatopsis saalfeldensis]SEO85324.1 DNA-binding transcriptional regulator, GntR family [Amycolatopsis saalfeldensis]